MSATETSLLLVRHGETDWNAAGRWQGHADPRLSERGRVQAAGLARALARADAARFTRVVASDLQRAAETAEILAEALGLDVVHDPRIRELDVGTWTGLTRAEIEARDRSVLEAFESGDPTVRPPGGETRLEIRLRAREFAEDLAKRYGGERIVVVTHLGVIRALLPEVEPRHLECFESVAEELARRPLDRSHGSARGPL